MLPQLPLLHVHVLVWGHAWGPICGPRLQPGCGSHWPSGVTVVSPGFLISKMKIMTVVTSWAGERTEHGTCSRSTFQKRWYYHWWHALWPLTLTTTFLIPVVGEEPGVYQGHITSCLGKQWPLPRTPVPLAAAHFFPRRSPCAWSPREAIGLRQGQAQLPLPHHRTPRAQPANPLLRSWGNLPFPKDPCSFLHSSGTVL